MSVDDSSTETTYVVVIRAGARLRFSPAEHLRIDLTIGKYKGRLVYQTRYCDEGYESLVPRELWIDARGSAESLNAAIVSFTNAASFFATVISFCGNGHAGDCAFHLAYDATPGRSEREFFEQFVHDERGLPRPSRKLKPHLIIAVIDALAVSPHSSRLRRAIVQYSLALKYWSKGEEILAVAHLYMGMESLVLVARSVEQARLALDSLEALATHMGVGIKDLDATIRKELLFFGDIESHRAAKRASDGVEHGFLDFDEVRPLATAVRDKVAGYLRQAIIRLLGVPADVVRELLEKPYERPLGTEGYVRYLRGHLLAEHNELAPEGQEYPLVEWRFGVQQFSLSEAGEMKLNFSQSMTPRLGEGVSFRPRSFEVYGPDGIVATSSQRQEIEPNITKRDTGYGPKSQEELGTMLQEAMSGGKVREVLVKTEDGHVFSISKDPPEGNS